MQKQGIGFILDMIDKIKFDDLQISEEVVNIIKNSSAKFLEQASTWISNFLTSMLSAVSSVATVGIYTVVTILATYFLCADRIYILDQIEHHFPKDWVKKLSRNIRKITKLLGGFLKAQVILIVINFILVLIRTICIQNIWIKCRVSITYGIAYSIFRCSADTRIWYSYDTLGSYMWLPRRHKPCSCINYIICCDNYCKTTARTQSSIRANRNTSDIYANCNVHRIQGNRNTRHACSDQ